MPDTDADELPGHATLLVHVGELADISATRRHLERSLGVSQKQTPFPIRALPHLGEELVTSGTIALLKA